MKEKQHEANALNVCFSDFSLVLCGEIRTRKCLLSMHIFQIVLSFH